MSFISFEEIVGEKDYPPLFFTTSSNRLIRILDFYCVNPECRCNSMELCFSSFHEINDPLFSLALSFHGNHILNTEIFDTSVEVDDVVEEFLCKKDLLNEIQKRKNLVKHKLKKYPFGWLDIPPLELDVCASYPRVYGSMDQGKFIFFFQGEEHYVEDHYCLNPDCDCKSSLMVFRKTSSPSVLFAIYVKIKSLEYSINSKRFFFSRKRLHQLARCFLKEIKGSPHLLKNRYKGMKRLGKHLYQEKGFHEPSIIFPKRNDLCYCGSGLKYKKCCGAFDKKVVFIKD